MPAGDGTGPAGLGPMTGRRAGYCVCPNCGHREPHQAGVPCYQVKCPECGMQMTRAR
jgi:hypothetical protein